MSILYSNGFSRSPTKIHFAERYKLLLKTRHENVTRYKFSLICLRANMASLPRTNRTVAMHSVYAVCRLFAMFPPGIIFPAFLLPVAIPTYTYLRPIFNEYFLQLTFWTVTVNVDLVILNFPLCPTGESLKKLQKRFFFMLKEF